MIRTHGRAFVCTECGAEYPLPPNPEVFTPEEVTRLWNELGVAVRQLRAEHADCKAPEPDYRLPHGTGVTDRRRKPDFPAQSPED